MNHHFVLSTTFGEKSLLVIFEVMTMPHSFEPVAHQPLAEICGMLSRLPDGSQAGKL